MNENNMNFMNFVGVAPRRCRAFATRMAGCVAVVVLLGAQCGLATTGLGADEIRDVLQQYWDSVGQLRARLKASAVSEKERMIWRRDWIERLKEVVRRNPHSAYRVAALSEVVGLANSCGDYEESREAVRALLRLCSDDPRAVARWLTELAEIEKLIYHQTRSSESLAAAIEAFSTANSAIRKQLESSPADGQLKEQLILNLYWMGELLSLSGREDQEALEQARTYFHTARQLLEALGTPTSRLAGKGYTLEVIARDEALASARAGDSDSALEALKYLARVGDRQWPASFYVTLCAERFPRRGAPYREFLQRWLAEAPEDDYTAVVKLLLAQSFFQEGELGKARVILEELYSRYRQQLLTLDGGAAVAGKGGYWASVLLRLAEIYRKEGDRAKARELDEMFARSYPHYGGLTKAARARVERAKSSTGTSNPAGELPDGPASPLRVALLVLGMALAIIVLATVLVFRSRNRTRGRP